MAQTSYPSDLSDLEWEILQPLIPATKSGGRPRTTDMRQVCNGIYYHLRTGCQWEYLPKDFPPSSTVYSFDGGKNVKGRRRQIWVDSLGLVLKVIVAEANGGERVLAAYALMELLEKNLKSCPNGGLWNGLSVG